MFNRWQHLKFIILLHFTCVYFHTFQSLYFDFSIYLYKFGESGNPNSGVTFYNNQFNIAYLLHIHPSFFFYLFWNLKKLAALFYFKHKLFRSICISIFLTNKNKNKIFLFILFFIKYFYLFYFLSHLVTLQFIAHFIKNRCCLLFGFKIYAI